MDFMDFKKITEMITNKKKGRRLFSLIFGVFLLGFIYNLILIPNKLMTGGISGIAIVVGEVTPINPNIFIYFMTIILLIVSFIFLGFKDTKNTIIGSILYPLMISLTAPLADYIKPMLSFDSIITPVVLAGIVIGFASGIVYKAGYNTGGSDILMKIFSKYGKMPEGKASMIVSIFIIALGTFVLGINQVIYACVLIFISTALIDKILIGINDTKMFFIQSEKYNLIKDYIISELITGVTELEIIGGYTKSKGKMLMVVIRTQDYYIFKESILAIDPNSFFVITDCYEVKGGVKRERSGIFNV